MIYLLRVECALHEVNLGRRSCSLTATEIFRWVKHDLTDAPCDRLSLQLE